MADLPGPLVIRRYRSSKDGAWLKRLPAPADPQGRVEGDCSSWVATLDGRLAAIATWQPTDPPDQCRAAITRLWVEPFARRLGIGTRLYFRLSSEIRKTYKKLGTRVREHAIAGDQNDPAAAPFLQSLKFDVKSDPPVRRFESD